MAQLGRIVPSLQYKLNNQEDDIRMKEDVIGRINMVINALNNVSVRGEENLANLSGSIGVLKGILNTLQNCIITPNQENTEKTEEIQE